MVVEDKGDVFNTDLTQALELGGCLELAACMIRGGLERKESRGAHSRPHDYPDRDDDNYLKHSLIRWVDGQPRAQLGARDDHQVGTRGEEVLILMQLGLKIWRSTRRGRRARAARVRGRHARRGDAARRPRARQGPPRRHAGLPAELPDDDLRLVRDAHRRPTVLACKLPMREYAEEGKVPVISPMGNLPIVKDLVVDMEPFWDKFRAVDPYVQPGYNVPPEGAST